MEYWIWLSLLKGIGPIIQRRLLNYFKDAESIYNASRAELVAIQGIGDCLYEIIKSTSLDEARSIFEISNRLNIKILTNNDHLYNEKAKLSPHSPIVLYYKGTLLNDSIGVGIVGARRCTSYGKEVVREAAQYLANENIPVISGMAKGIDGYAHTACLKAGGYTLAFLGNGVDICYPSEHSELMERIIENGAVLSQLPPGTRPKPEYFPKRNTLISAWSEKLLVVEAGESSGSLITAQYTKELGREVLAVPNQIYAPLGKGTNNLILKGAQIYLHPEQLLLDGKVDSQGNSNEDAYLNKNIKNTEPTYIKRLNREFTQNEKEVIACITDNFRTIEELSQLIKINQIDLVECLSILELEGIIQTLPGGKFKLK